MRARRIGLWLGPALFALTLLVAPPASMPLAGWHCAGLVMWIAAWWVTEAIPLSATALLPFVILPLIGVGTAASVAGAYYTPITFLILGGAMLALAIERTDMHRRLALALVSRSGKSAFSLLLAFMVATAVLSMLISNTSSALIMLPMALAVITGATGSTHDPDNPDTEGLSGALPIGIAFAATIGGLGTIVGTPTNAIAVGLLDEMLGFEISFALWMAFGIPLVAVALPLAAWLIARVQRLSAVAFDASAARDALTGERAWTTPQKRLIPVIALAFAGWLASPLLKPWFPDGAIHDATIAIVASLALFLIPDGTGRPLLQWREADRAPWGVLLLFGGGLALASGMAESGLAEWLGAQLLPLAGLPLFLLAMAICAMVIAITEFASNVATGSAIIPVIAGLIAALGADPMLLAMPAAIAASWGYMLPAGTGPNAIAWSSGRIALPRMIKAGVLLDIAGIALIPGIVFAVAALV